MRGAESLRDRACVAALVEARFVEADAEGVELARGRVLRGERGDGGGIDAAAQKDAERHVGHEPALHRALELCTNLFTPLRCRGPGIGLEDKLPPPPGLQRPARRRVAFHGGDRVELVAEAVAARQLPDALVDAARRWDVAVGEVFPERQR